MKRSHLLLIGTVIIFGPPVALGFLVAHFRGFWDGVIAGIVTAFIVLAIAYYWVMRHTTSGKGEKPND